MVGALPESRRSASLMGYVATPSELNPLLTNLFCGEIGAWRKGRYWIIERGEIGEVVKVHTVLLLWQWRWRDRQTNFFLHIILDWILSWSVFCWHPLFTTGNTVICPFSSPIINFRLFWSMNFLFLIILNSHVNIDRRFLKFNTNNHIFITW